MVQWGDPIEVNGFRPAWLRDDDWNTCAVLKDGRRQVPGANTMRNTEDWQWEVIAAIELPAGHPYYIATAKGYTYWPGKTNSAPEDWNRSADFVMADGLIWSGVVAWWDRKGDESDIIGYRNCGDKTVTVTVGSNHVVAAPASYRGEIGITPEFIALIVNERDELRKRVTGLLEANNREVKLKREAAHGLMHYKALRLQLESERDEMQQAFERSQDELATVRTELDTLKNTLGV